jgi:hypothetical protein
VKPLVSGFKAVLDRRKTKKSGFMEDWPLIKYPDSPKAANWGIHFSCNKAGIDLADLEAGDGIPGLSFGHPWPLPLPVTRRCLVPGECAN